jgi:hypothetical protein
LREDRRGNAIERLADGGAHELRLLGGDLHDLDELLGLEPFLEGLRTRRHGRRDICNPVRGFLQCGGQRIAVHTHGGGEPSESILLTLDFEAELRRFDDKLTKRADARREDVREIDARGDFEDFAERAAQPDQLRPEAAEDARDFLGARGRDRDFDAASDGSASEAPPPPERQRDEHHGGVEDADHGGSPSMMSGRARRIVAS